MSDDKPTVFTFGQRINVDREALLAMSDEERASVRLIFGDAIIDTLLSDETPPQKRGTVTIVGVNRDAGKITIAGPPASPGSSAARPRRRR